MKKAPSGMLIDALNSTRVEVVVAHTVNCPEFAEKIFTDRLVDSR